jgi:tetratricopeptide (TPR) repeat protein/arylsulfatase A-like enzyme
MRLARRVLLVGWDGADWKLANPLLDAGRLPALQHLVESGVMGNLATLTPMLSPMLWTSIATGRRADAHGILDFVEPDSERGRVRPVRSTSRRVKALWNILHQSGLRSIVVNWLATHPAEPIDGAVVSGSFMVPTGAGRDGWPVAEGSLHPPELAEALAPLRVHPSEIGPDELRPFVPRLDALDPADERLRFLAAHLAEAASVQACTTWLMEQEPWDLLAVYFPAIDRLGHRFMRFHPPRLEGVDADEQAMFAGVMDATYAFHDQLLARLLALCGPDTAVLVVSDHGFQSGALRPRERPQSPSRDFLLSWHRPYGVLALAGPGLRRDERAYGASLLDVAPTVLALLGLPVGRDLEGRVLATAFEEPPEPLAIESWETVPGDAGLHPGESRTEDPWESWLVLDQLARLGYVEAPDADGGAALRRLDRERRLTLARVHLEAGRIDAAGELLTALLGEAPEDGRAKLALARCRHALGDLAGCRRLVLEAFEAGQPRAQGEILLALAAIADEKPEDALAHLEQAARAAPPETHVPCSIGEVYLRMGRFEDAGRAFERALEVDDDCARAHHGLAVAALGRGLAAEAAAAALRAVGLRHHLPQAHYHLALALARLGDTPRAVQALDVCLRLRPDHARAKALRGRLLRDGASARFGPRTPAPADLDLGAAPGPD